MRQCLGRNDDWKAFYAEQMEGVKPKGANEELLRIYAAELDAEHSYIAGEYAGASDKLQHLLDMGKLNGEDRAWYLQEMARYTYRANRPESDRLQIAAYKANRLLLKPASGVTVAQLKIVSQGRMERITKWIQHFDDYSQLDVALSDHSGAADLWNKGRQIRGSS